MDFHTLDIRHFLLESIPFRFKQLSPIEFGQLIGYLFEVDGYEVQHAGQDGDLSGMVLANKEGTRLVILPLQHAPEVMLSEGEIGKAIQARKFYATDQAWIITTASFSAETKQLAEEEEIELWDWDALYAALCQLFFEGKSHLEYHEQHPQPPATVEEETVLKLKVKWQATEGTSTDWYNLGITITNPSERNIYLHLDLPALIDSKRNQVMAEQWADAEFVSGMLYAGASVRTNALFSVSKLGDRPQGGRIVLTCHERREVPVTIHLQARLRGEACFIVTYCYTRESPEYDVMVRYRDEVLAENVPGRWLIRIYYLLSPQVVKWASCNRTVDVLLKKLMAKLIPVFSRRMSSYIDSNTYNRYFK